jgi:hypothetical protein
MFYRPFHQFGQAKFPDSGSILGLSQFLILAQLPLNTMLGLKVVEIDSKISNSLCKSKFVTQSVGLIKENRRYWLLLSHSVS